MQHQCAIIILAAGASSRLSKPKQSLLFNHSTLLDHSIEVALDSVADEVIVVLGAHAANIQSNKKEKKLAVVINNEWQEGISSSIRCGLRFLLKKSPGIQSALFMVCDQPYTNAALLNKLVTLQKQTGELIAASEYAGTTGIPAVFNKELFTALLQLKGDTGAKKIIMQQQNKIATVSFPLGNIDIDTEEDYSRLQKQQ